MSVIFTLIPCISDEGTNTTEKVRVRVLCHLKIDKGNCNEVTGQEPCASAQAVASELSQLELSPALFIAEARILSLHSTHLLYRLAVITHRFINRAASHYIQSTFGDDE